MAMDFNSEDRPDQGLQDKLQNGDTTFKNVPLPDTNSDEQNFQEVLASDRYKEVVQKVRHYTGIETKMNGLENMTPLIIEMQSALYEIISLERGHKEELEKLAVDVVIKEMGIPEGVIQFNAKLVGVGEVSSDNFNTDDTEQMEEIELDLFNTLENMDFEKAKRRMINSIIQGASKRGHYMFHAVENELSEILGSNNIANLYGILMSVNDTLYWQMSDQKISSAGGDSSNIAGKVEININTDPPTIHAQGFCFPVLVHELIKGMMELFAVQGRTGDEDVDDEVELSEDILQKEMWDLRLGPAIWGRLRSQFPEEIVMDENQVELQNYLLVEIFKLPARRFSLFMKEVLVGSDVGKEMINTLMKGIEEMFNDEDYDEETNEFNHLLDTSEKDISDDEILDFLKEMGFDPDSDD